jgi:hypothetical protein
VIGDELRGFERALVFQVSSDAGGAEGVIADRGGNAGFLRGAITVPANVPNSA